MCEAENFLVEVHLQETFENTPVLIFLGQRKVAELVAQTRFQIGLAAIEKVEATEGEEISIQIGDEIKARVAAQRSQPFIIVKMADNRVDVTTTGTAPFYM